MNDYIKALNSLVVTKSDRLPSVGLFSGGGGLDLGLSLAGFNMAYANDNDKASIETIKHNLKHCHAVAKSAFDLTGKEILEAVGSKEIELLAGGSPCQSFSISGKRAALNDQRGQLVFEHIRLINEIQPRAFIFENVPGILTSNKGEDWKLLIKAFAEQTGYEINFMVLNAADYGVPQTRKRVFVVGFREFAMFDFPKALLSPNNWIPSRNALINCEQCLFNNTKRIHSKETFERYKNTPPGKKEPIHKNIKINPVMPSCTVLAGGNGGGLRFIHPWEPRQITTREAARLQSFPDWYEFKGTSTQQYRQVGNAVPVLMAKALGESIKKALS